MKQLLAFALLFAVLFSRAQNIPARPDPPRLVNDYAHTMTAEQVDALERKLVAYNDSTSTQVVIVTLEPTDDYPVEMYSLKILREWGVGNKKNNNGIVVLADMKNHRLRIETGSGMEGSIPDITASHIIETDLTPNFKSQNYYRGFDAATDDIFKAAAGEYKAPEGYTTHKGNKGGALLGGIIFFIIIIIVISRSNRGGGGGGMMSRSGVLPWLLIDSFMNSGRGGGGGGGGWSGGGGGGGGFGGFGGGGGGGGGASGGW